MNKTEKKKDEIQKRIHYNRYAEHFVNDAIQAVKMFLEISSQPANFNLSYQSQLSPVLKSLWHSSTISYYKIHNTGKVKRGDKILKELSEEEKILHEEIKEERNEFIAHFDGSNKFGLSISGPTHISFNGGKPIRTLGATFETRISIKEMTERLQLYQKTLKILKVHNQNTLKDYHDSMSLV